MPGSTDSARCYHPLTERALVMTMIHPSITTTARPAVLTAILLLLSSCGVALDDDARMERARVAYEEARYAATIVDTKTVLRNTPSDTQARALLGRALAENGEFEEALRHLEQALEEGHPLGDFHLQLVAARLYSGQAESALAIAEPETATDDFEAFRLWIYRGDAQFELGLIVDALRSYAEADGLYVDSSKARIRAAEVHWYQGNFDAARNFVEGALEEEPDNVDAVLMLGDILAETERWSTAEQVLTDALNELTLDSLSEGYLHASLVQVFLASGDVNAARRAVERVGESWSADDLDYQRLDAQVALAEGHYDEAVMGLGAYLASLPDSVTASRLMGEVRLGLGSPEQARVLLERALNAEPRHVDTMRLLCRTYLLLDEPDFAYDSLEWALYLEGSDPATLVLPGLLHLSGLPEDDPQRSIVDLLIRQRVIGAETQDAISNFSDPDDPAHQNLSGLAQLAEGNVAGALKEFSRASESDPNVSTYRLNLASAHLANEQPSEGLAALGELDGPIAGLLRRALVVEQQSRGESGDALVGWLSARPDDSDARFALAHSYLGAARYNEAARQLEYLVEEGADDADTYNNLAWSYLHIGDERALTYAEQALELAPDRGEILDTVGWVLVSGGQPNRGVQYLRDANVLLPGDTEVALHLAIALSQTGQEGEAMVLLEGLLAMGPSDEREAAANLLSELGARQ